MKTTIEEIECLNEAINESIKVIATELKVYWLMDKLRRKP